MEVEVVTFHSDLLKFGQQLNKFHKIFQIRAAAILTNHPCLKPRES